jgi:hypothetical protein
MAFRPFFETFRGIIPLLAQIRQCITSLFSTVYASKPNRQKYVNKDVLLFLTGERLA